MKPGVIVLGLVLDTLTGRSPPYRPADFCEGRDTEFLPGERVAASSFNDDTVGRALDLLFETGTRKICSESAMNAALKHGISTRVVRFDTTSVNVYGGYEADAANPPPLEITEGYGKDRRPDLKQFPVSTLCVGDKIPIYGKHEDGNASDKEIDNTLLSEISRQMARFGAAEKGFVYIADSALVSPGKTERLSPGRLFVTRVPAVYAEWGRVIPETVSADRWVEVGPLARTEPAANRAAESAVTLYGNEYRAVVVHSSVHDKRRQKKIDREPAREKTSLERNFKRQCMNEYACEADARAAAQPARCHELAWEIEPHCTYARGRPQNGEPGKVTRGRYRVSFRIEQSASALERMEKRGRMFCSPDQRPRGRGGRSQGDSLPLRGTTRSGAGLLLPQGPRRGPCDLPQNGGADRSPWACPAHFASHLEAH